MTRSRAAAEALRQDDAEARVFAQREFQSPVVLEAGAGTGKTATLVARILSWCLGAGWERAAAVEDTPDRVAARVLEGVVAITFTEAAAAEMAERVEAVLDDIAQGELPDTLSELSDLAADDRTLRAAALRSNVDRLVVQTIHAWCRSLLRRFPLEAGLHPDFEVDADARIHRELVREVLDETLREAYGDPGDAVALDLAARGFGPGELEEALLALLEAGIGPGDLALDPLGRERLGEAGAALASRLSAWVEAEGGALAACKRSRRSRQTAQTLVATLERLAQPPGDASELEAFCDWLREHWDGKDLERLDLWARQQFGAEESEQLGARGERLAAATRALAPDLRGFLRCDPALLSALHHMLRGLLDSVATRVRARGVLTFQALLEGCATLLGERPGVAAQVRRGIDQLLVDEFQDTDARQCAIVAALALTGTAEERPGLFLVGDPKQSIYGWRSADLAAYEAFVESVKAAGGVVRRLSVNHRSVPAVLDEVDRVMPGVMQARVGLQPAFEPLVASARNARRAGWGDGLVAPIEHWLPIERGADGLRQTSLGDATRLEARALASDLRRIHDDHGVPWASVGLLFRSRGDWDVYLSALREADVPFNVEGDRSYYKRREIIDAAALVRCVLDPEDRLALTAAMRCSAVGVPDAALGPLFEAGLADLLGSLPDEAALEALGPVAQQVADGLPGDLPGIDRIRGWQHSLTSFARSVAELRALYVSAPGDLFVETLRARTLFEVGEAGRFLGSWRAANLERFFCELADWMGAGVPVGEVLRRLRHAVAEEEPREEGRPRDLLPDAVSILTLHGAKGLDFDHVYLMQLHKGGGRGEGDVVTRRVAGRAELRVHGVETLGYGRARQTQQEVAAFERVRLLYVGMTRAKQRLVMSWLPGAFRRGRDESLAQLVGQRVPEMPDPATLEARCRADRTDRIQDGEALWVLPAHGEARETPGRVHRDTTGIDVARVAEDAAALGRLAELARSRMDRPFAGRASDVDAGAERAQPSPDARVAPDVARAVGTLVHLALESFDTRLAPTAALDDVQARLHVGLLAVPEALRHEVLVEATVLLEALRGGALLERLHRLGDAILARELPLLLAPGADDAAVGYLSGAIDLLARDPADGAYLVVDYKTDRVEGTAALDARAQEHAAQGAVYCRAVQEALGLPSPPRFEVWFLAHDRALRVETTGGSPPSAPAEVAVPLQLGLDLGS